MKKILEKIKIFYNEHRIFVILMGIVIVCVILMIVFMLRYFYFGTGDAPSRSCANLRNDKAIVKNLTDSELVTDATIRVSEKSNVIFITIRFTSETTIAEAQSEAVKSLDGFTEEEKECYDLEFSILAPAGEKSESYTLLGSANESGSNIIWTNNN